jgi:hypothetical protein
VADRRVALPTAAHHGSDPELAGTTLPGSIRDTKVTGGMWGRQQNTFKGSVAAEGLTTMRAMVADLWRERELR